MNQDINVLALVKGAERYVFLYDDSSRAETLRVLGRYASNPELSFTWYDAAVLSQKIRQESRKAPRTAPLRAAAAQRRRRTTSCLALRHAPLAGRRYDRSLQVSSRMQTAVDRFLQYLRVERNASELTIKSYREDLAALVEYLHRRRAAALPAPGDSRARSSCAATWRRCTRPATPRRRSPGGWPRCAASFASASAKAGPRRIRPSRCAIRARRARCRTFSRREDIGRLLGRAAGRRAAGPARSGDSGSAVLGRPARQRTGRAERRRPRLRRRHAARPRQGAPRADRAGRLVRRPSAQGVAGRADAVAARKGRARRRRCSSTSSAAG